MAMLNEVSAKLLNHDSDQHLTFICLLFGEQFSLYTCVYMWKDNKADWSLENGSHCFLLSFYQSLIISSQHPLGETCYITSGGVESHKLNIEQAAWAVTPPALL